MLPYLCPEVTDVIIDHLHNDKSSLAACGLTHRTWLPSSRYHLFSNVTLSVNNVRSFDELLNNPSDHIALQVRHLTVAPRPVDGAPVAEKRRAQSAAVLQVLPRLTTYLHKVKFLTFRDLDWDSCSTETSQHILTDLCGVEVLELSSFGVRGMHEVVDIICAFPLLTTLSLKVVRTNEAEDRLLHLSHSSASTATYRRRPLFNIDTIDLHSPLPSAFRDWLLNPVPNIHTVRCGPYNPSVFLARAGGSIREIEISCCLISIAQEPLINITKCTSLRSIRFHSISLSEFYTHQHQQYIPPILTQVSAPSFEELSFEIDHAPFSGLPIRDWSDVVDALLSPQFTDLKRVCIKWPNSGAQFADSLLVPFSPISKRGIVQLEFY